MFIQVYGSLNIHAARIDNVLLPSNFIHQFQGLFPYSHNCSSHLCFLATVVFPFQNTTPSTVAVSLAMLIPSLPSSKGAL